MTQENYRAASEAGAITLPHLQGFNAVGWADGLGWVRLRATTAPLAGRFVC